jgi:mycothiol synthase
LEYVRRNFAGIDDLPALLELFRVCADSDQTGERTIRDDLIIEYVEDEPGWRRAISVWTGDGEELVAQAGLWTPENPTESRSVYCACDIHPKARESGVPSEVIDWIIRNSREIGPVDGQVGTGVHETATWKRGLLASAGFEIERYFWRMKRDLAEPIAPSLVLDGYAFRAISGVDEVPRWIDLFNVAWRDHWEFTPYELSRRLRDIELSDYRPEMDRVAIGPDGDFVALYQASIREYPDQAAEYWIQLVATHPEHRHKGLAKAMLADALARAKELGFQFAWLSVDAESLTGATRIYTEAGFVVARTVLAMKLRYDAPPQA